MGISDRGLKIITALLLVVGVQFWLIGSRGEWIGPSSLWVIGITCAAALIPPLRRAVSGCMDRVDRIESPWHRRLIAFGVAVASTLYFLLNASQQGMGFYLTQHDEFSYLIQTRTLLSGHLWMPQPPVADFFETFHFIVKPVYASKYFIGTALMYAPGIAIGLPYWLLPATVAGAAIGLGVLLIARLTSLSGGLIAAVMFIASSLLRRAAALYMSFAPILLLIELGLLVFLQWQQQHESKRRLAWAAILGAVMSFAAVTRPVDALCFGIPMGIAVLFTLARIRSLRQIMANIAVMVLAATPLLGTQLIANRGITGSAFDTPWTFYARHSDPYDGFTATLPHGTVTPGTTLPQKIEFMKKHSVAALEERRKPEFMQRWINRDLQSYMAAMFPHPLLLCLVPVAFLSLRRLGRIVLAAGVPFVFIAYTLYAFPDVAYILITVPAGALLVVGAVESLSRAWPGSAAFIRAWMAMCIVTLCIVRLPQVNRFQIDSLFRPRELWVIDEAVKSLPHKPAVVLFHYAPGDSNPEVEPVYNYDVAWPIDAPVIRAQDLGARNREIFSYFAGQSPERWFYVYNRADRTLHELGPATKLAAEAASQHQ